MLISEKVTETEFVTKTSYADRLEQVEKTILSGAEVLFGSSCLAVDLKNADMISGHQCALFGSSC